jgi:hypothetical protein
LSVAQWGEVFFSELKEISPFKDHTLVSVSEMYQSSRLNIATYDLENLLREIIPERENYDECRRFTVFLPNTKEVKIFQS